MARAEAILAWTRRLPPLAVDAALAFGVVLVTILELVWWLPARDPTAHAQVLDYVLMSASTATLVLRRRHPLVAWAVSRACAIPVALHAVYGENIGTHILAVLMLFVIAERCSRPVAVAGFLAEYGLINVAVFVLHFSAQDTFQSFFYFGFLYGFVWFAGRAQRYRKRLAGELAAQTTELRHEQERLAAQAVAAERRRIVRELQSLVIQGIERMALETGSARTELAIEPTQAPRAIEAIERTGRRTLGEMGRVLALMDGAEASVPEAVESEQGAGV